MEPISDSEQRTEAFRAEVLGHLQRQTQAAESIRGIVLFFTALIVLGCVIAIAFAVQSGA